MARGEQSTFIPCPAKHMLEWDGGHGTLKMWDAVNKEKLQLELPFEFAWVEEFGYINGFSNQLRTSFHSNEIHGRHLKKKPFEVYHFEKDGDKNKKVVDATGLYHDIKPQLAVLGASYCKMIYCIALCDNGPVKKGDFIRILASPSFCQEWYDFGKNNRVDEGSVFIDGNIPRSNGNINYNSPVFLMEKIDADMEALAIASVEPLKAYYRQSPTEAEQPKADAPSDPADEEEGEIPF